MSLPLSIVWMPSVQRSISETAPLSINLKPFLGHSSNRRLFNCCIDSGLSLELFIRFAWNENLHIISISMTSLQISLVDLALLSKLYLQGKRWCDDLIVLLSPFGTAFKETSPFLTKKIKFSP